MKKIPSLTLSAALLSVLTADHLRAAEATNPHLWGVGANDRVGFNRRVSVRNAGLTPSVRNPSVNGRSCDDGFVGMESIGYAPEPADPWARPLTSYSGFQHRDQIVPDAAGGRALLLPYAEPGEFGQGTPWDLLSHGFAFTLTRDLYRLRTTHLGLEAGIGLSWPGLDRSGRTYPDALGAERFAFPGWIPGPAAPYPGVYESFGGDPWLQVSANLDAMIYALRLGPYLEQPLGKGVSLSLGGGLSFAVVDLRESAGGTSGHYLDRPTDLLIGFHLGGQVHLKLSDRCHLRTGLQYHALDDWEQRVVDKVAQIDLGNTLYWCFGLEFLF